MKTKRVKSDSKKARMDSTSEEMKVKRVKLDSKKARMDSTLEEMKVKQEKMKYDLKRLPEKKTYKRINTITHHVLARF